MRYRLISLAAAAAFMILPVLAQAPDQNAQNAAGQRQGGRGGRGGRGAAAPAKPTPRNPDGTVIWGPEVGQTGLWNVAGGTFADPDRAPGTPAPANSFPGKPTLSEVPFQPWARAVYDRTTALAAAALLAVSPRWWF